MCDQELVTGLQGTWPIQVIGSIDMLDKLGILVTQTDLTLQIL
jgi:hypothetical protein